MDMLDLDRKAADAVFRKWGLPANLLDSSGQLLKPDILAIVNPEVEVFDSLGNLTGYTTEVCLLSGSVELGQHKFVRVQVPKLSKTYCLTQLNYSDGVEDKYSASE